MNQVDFYDDPGVSNNPSFQIPDLFNSLNLKSTAVGIQVWFQISCVGPSTTGYTLIQGINFVIILSKLKSNLVLVK